MRCQVAALACWLVGCSCPMTPTRTPRPAPSTSIAPIGRIRTGTFSCPHGDVQHFRVSYPWPNEDGGAVIEQPLPAPWGSTPGIYLCGAWAGVENAEVIACRDAETRFDGPVEMLASDHSMVLQGYCSKGAPIGPWVTWRAGQAVDIVAQDGTGFRGLHVHNPPPDRHDLETRDEYEGALVDGAHR